jgi:hypothetical protein
VFNVNDFIFHSCYKNDEDVENMEDKYKTLVLFYVISGVRTFVSKHTGSPQFKIEGVDE